MKPYIATKAMLGLEGIEVTVTREDIKRLDRMIAAKRGEYTLQQYEYDVNSTPRLGASIRITIDRSGVYLEAQASMGKDAQAHLSFSEFAKLWQTEKRVY